eukprot:scaffold79406_cov32-Tisochrysis_lutea.AAC.1
MELRMPTRRVLLPASRRRCGMPPCDRAHPRYTQGRCARVAHPAIQPRTENCGTASTRSVRHTGRVRAHEGQRSARSTSFPRDGAHWPVAERCCARRLPRLPWPSPSVGRSWNGAAAPSRGAARRPLSSGLLPLHIFILGRVHTNELRGLYILPPHQQPPWLHMP